MPAPARLSSTSLSAFAIVAGLTLLGGMFSCSGPTGGDGDVADLPRLEAREDLRIGSVDDPNTGFSRIGNVSVDRDGQIYVYELLDNEIRVYDGAGRLIHSIGRPGRGPGEFGQVSRFGVVGDTVWVVDLSQRRVTVFDRRGTVLSTGNLSGVPVELQNGRMTGMVMPRALRADGLFSADMTMFVGRRDASDNGIASTDTVMIPLVLFNAAGSVVDTIGWEPYPPPVRRELQRVEVGSTRYNVPLAPDNQPLIVRLAEGRFVIDRAIASSDGPAVFTVSRLTEAGDTLFTRSFDYRPRRYPDAVLDTFAWRSARIPGGAYNPITGPAPTPEGVDINIVRGLIRNAMEFPTYQRPVEFGIAGDNGALWLRLEDDGGPSYRWLILDASGASQGVLTVPRELQVRLVSLDEFIAVETDDFDIPWLVRYTVHGGQDGS